MFTPMDFASCRVLLIYRNKLIGPGRHYGVAFLNGFGDPPAVYEFQKGVGFLQTSMSEFAQGRQVTEELEVRGGELVAGAAHRLQQLRSRSPGYDLIARNCEHIARYVITGKLESHQIHSVGLVAVGVLILFLCSRG